MRRTTHTIFGASAAMLAARLAGADNPVLLLIVAVFAGFMQEIIDAASHEEVRRRGYVTVRRTPLFHSLLGVTLLSLLFSGFLWFMVRAAPAALAASMVVSGLSHLLLDSLTEGGIYWRGRRVRVAGFRYNDPLLNLLFSLLGLLLAYVALTGDLDLLHPLGQG